MNRRNIMSSLSIVLALVAIYVGATGAFFSDTFASEDNVFTTEGVTIAMSDITHTYNGTPGVGEPADPTGFSYDGTNKKFAFADLKPLDWGTLDFDIANQDNEAYVCAYVDGTAPTDPPANDVALYDNLQFYTGDTQLTFGNWIDLGVLSAAETTGLEVDYCFGDPTVGTNGIVNCAYNPSVNYNAAQYADFSADFYLFAIQTRNNSGFTCDALTFNPGASTLDDAVTLDPGAYALTVGAEVLAYETPAETGASCDLTVDASLTSTADPFFDNLTDAEAAVEDGETICVDAGIYEEDVTVDVPNVTILGINDPKGVDAATVDGRMDINADGVTVSGLAFTNPDAGYGIVINGVDNTLISFNTFTDIGTSYTGRSAQAIYYDGAADPATGLVISDNTITGVGSDELFTVTTGSGSSAKGIFIGDSTSPEALTDVLIQNNVISDVDASDASGSSNGKGAYGILVNYGVGSTGSVVAPLIRFNTISNLNGAWANVISLDTDTPGAVVSFNDLSDATANGASNGVWFDGNASSDVDVVFNNLDPGLDFGVGVHFANPSITVNAENNWWGDTDPSDNVTVSGTGSTIDFDPFAGGAYPTN